MATSKEIFISVDIETAGPIPAEYSLLSIGASVVSNVRLNFYAELKPINTNAVPEALAISGLDLATLQEHGEEPGAALARFRDWIHDAATPDLTPVFVAFNAAFDWSFVNWYFQKYLGENPFGFAPLDIKAYYMGLTGCGWSETTSSKLPAEFQPTETRNAHNALADAQVTGRDIPEDAAIATVFMTLVLWLFRAATVWISSLRFGHVFGNGSGVVSKLRLETDPTVKVIQRS